jgi:hypothetical protein
VYFQKEGALEHNFASVIPIFIKTASFEEVLATLSPKREKIIEENSSSQLSTSSQPSEENYALELFDPPGIGKTTSVEMAAKMLGLSCSNNDFILFTITRCSFQI